MQKFFIAACVLLLAGTAYAGIPLLNYSCPEGLEVHADEGGPVYINGRETKLKRFNDNYYEASGSGVTVSIGMNPDGSLNVLYSGKHGANGVCRESQAGGSSARGATSISETGSEGDRRESRHHGDRRHHGRGESRKIKCESRGSKYDYCETHTTGRVELHKQLSKASCREYDTWGADGDGSGIWVREGCRAEFVVTSDRRGSDEDRSGADRSRASSAESVKFDDLVGARASSGESELEARGFRNVDGFKSGNASYTIWYNRRTRQCLQVATAEGRYDSVTDIHEHPKCGSESIGHSSTEATQSQRVSSSERAGQGQFDAKGNIPCAQYKGQPMGQCKFGVARDGDGSATVVVTRPDGRKRAIFFEKGKAINADLSQADGNMDFRASKEADLYKIQAGDERYEIPEAVIFGG